MKSVSIEAQESYYANPGSNENPVSNGYYADGLLTITETNP